MKPWEIIGWLIVFLLALAFLVLSVVAAVVAFHKAKHDFYKTKTWRKTRLTPPAADQRWLIGGKSVWIKRVSDNGYVTTSYGHPYDLSVHPGNGFTAEEWQRYVDRNKGYLVYP